MKRAISIVFVLTLAVGILSATPVTLVRPNFGTIVAEGSNGQRYTPQTDAYDIAEGTVLTLHYEADGECARFAQWIVEGAAIEDNTLRVGKTAITVYARFQVIQYTIAAEVYPANAGSAIVRCGVGNIFIDVAGAVNCGSTVLLAVAEDASTGLHFVQWNDGVTDSRRYVNADADKTYIAYFVVPDDMVALPDVETDPRSNSRVYIEDGQLIIEHNQQRYNALGQRIR